MEPASSPYMSSGTIGIQSVDCARRPIEAESANAFDQLPSSPQLSKTTLLFLCMRFHVRSYTPLSGASATVTERFIQLCSRIWWTVVSAILLQGSCSNRKRSVQTSLDNEHDCNDSSFFKTRWVPTILKLPAHPISLL